MRSWKELLIALYGNNSQNVVWGVAHVHLFVLLVLVLIFRKMPGEVLVAGFVAGILVDSLYLHNILPVIIPDLLKALVGDNVFFISFRTCLIALMRPDVPDVDVVPVLVR